jgi:hypothetical protein
MKIKVGGRRFSLVFNTFVIKMPIPLWSRFRSGILSNKIESSEFSKGNISTYLGRVHGSYFFNMFLFMERYYYIGDISKLKKAPNYPTMSKHFNNFDGIRNFGMDKLGFIYVFDYGDTTIIKKSRWNNTMRQIILTLNLNDDIIKNDWNNEECNK